MGNPPPPPPAKRRTTKINFNMRMDEFWPTWPIIINKVLAAPMIYNANMDRQFSDNNILFYIYLVMMVNLRCSCAYQYFIYFYLCGKCVVAYMRLWWWWWYDDDYCRSRVCDDNKAIISFCGVAFHWHILLVGRNNNLFNLPYIFGQVFFYIFH